MKRVGVGGSILRPSVWLAFLAAMAGASTSAVAGIVVFDSPLNTTIPWGWNSTVNGRLQQTADDVTLAQDAIIDAITFYGFAPSGRMNGQSNIFVVRFFAHDASTGQPEASPFYEHSVGLLAVADSGQNGPKGLNILEYNVDIPDVALSEGVLYWLMIGSTNSNLWSWSYSNAAHWPDDTFQRDGDADTWRSMRERNHHDLRMDQAITLYATVPAAPTAAVFGLLFPGFPRARRTR